MENRVRYVSGRRDTDINNSVNKTFKNDKEIQDVNETKPSSSIIIYSSDIQSSPDYPISLQPNLSSSECSFMSDTSIEFSSRAKSIKTKNQKLHQAVVERMSLLKEASDNLTQTRAKDSIRISLLNAELDSLKKNIFDCLDENPSKKTELEFDESSIEEIKGPELALSTILEQVKALHGQISRASVRFEENEKEIMLTEGENTELKDKINQLETQMFEFITRDDSAKQENCVCKIF